MRNNASNNGISVLASDITATDTSIMVQDASGFPKVPFLVTLNREEILKVMDVDNNKFTVERGQEGTEAKGYPEYTQVENNLTAGMYRRLASDIDDTINDLADLKDEVTEHQAESATEAHNGISILNESITVTVGNDADFKTINDALEFLTTHFPKVSTEPVSAVIELQSGFVMSEQVVVEGVNLSWIKISAQDEVVSVDATDFRSLISVSSTDIKSTLAATHGGTLPVIDCLFSLDYTDGDVNDIKGICAVYNSRAIITEGSGFKKAADNIYANTSSIIEANYCIASDSISMGISAFRNSAINAYGSDVSNSGVDGILAQHNSRVLANNSNVSNAGRHGINATLHSKIGANSVNALGAGDTGIYVNQSSTVEAWGAEVGGYSKYGIYANQGSTINAVRIKARKDTSDTSSDIVVGYGSVIATSSSGEGGTSQAFNEVTTAGIIFG